MGTSSKQGSHDYSTTPASNDGTTAAGDAGMPENMAASAVNNAARQIMADIREAHVENAEWIDWGHAPTRTGNTTFTVSGDQTAVYQVGRRIRVYESTPNTWYGVITASSHSGGTTTVTVQIDTGDALTASLNRVYVGILSLDNPSFPTGLAQPNVIIDGDLRFWPENTAFGARTSGQYGPFCAGVKYQTTSGVVDVNQSTNTPTDAEAGRGIPYSMEIDTTTNVAVSTDNDYYAVMLAIAGEDFDHIRGQTATLGFWIRSPVTGNYAVAFRTYTSSSVNDSYVTSFAISSADTWEFKTFTVDFSGAAGTIDGNSSRALDIMIILAANATTATTNGTTTSEAWLGAGNDKFLLTDITQVNALADNTDTPPRITGLVLQKGSSISPILPTMESQRIDRNYEKSYAMGTAVATVTNTGRMFYGRGPNGDGFPIRYRTEMRTTPTVTFWSTDSGTSGKAYNVDTASDVNMAVAQSASTGFICNPDAGSDGDRFSFHYEADARFSL